MGDFFLDEELLDKFKNEEIFLKSTSKGNVQGSEKAALNRKGNELFNRGEMEKARRIFITTGYSDGLSRIGDYYKKKGRLVDALQMYWTAHNKKKSDELCVELSIFIKGLLSE